MGSVCSSRVIAAPHLGVPAGRGWPDCIIIMSQVDSSAVFASCSVDITYERMSFLKLGLTAPPLLRMTESVIA